MNYKESLTKNEICAHAAHYEQTNPAVYCGTYAKYNRGSLYGMWIDLTTFETYREFIEFCNRLHADEQDAELMFQDYEHFPSQWYCEGCMGESTFDKIKEYAALSEERREAYEAYLSYWDEGTLEDFEERYEGKYNGPKISPSTFARSAATLRTCRSGSNAALIIQPFGARSIRAEIIPRSMGTSSGIEQGQRKLFFA